MYRRPRPPLKLIADSGKTRRGEKEEKERKSRVAYTCELCACDAKGNAAIVYTCSKFLNNGFASCRVLNNRIESIGFEFYLR